MARYTRKPVDVTALLQQNTLLQGNEQAEIVRQLNTELIRILQLEKPYFCKVSRIQAGRAQILCGSAAWATRLKMQRTAILDNFRQKILPELAGIDIEVSPVGQTKPLLVQEQPVKPYCATLSSDTRSQLQQAAAQTDGPVQQALQRLLRNMPDNTPR